MFDSETATPGLEIADDAMPVHDEWRRLRIAPVHADRVNDFARSGDVVPDPHGSTAVAIPMNEYSGVWQHASGLQQRKRTETKQQGVRKVRFVPGTKQDGDKGAEWR